MKEIVRVYECSNGHPSEIILRENGGVESITTTVNVQQLDGKPVCGECADWLSLVGQTELTNGGSEE